MEAAESPHQDNTTVLVYAPDAGAELAAADVGEKETAQKKPQFNRRARLSGMLLCVVILLGVLYLAIRRSEDAVIEAPSATVEAPSATNGESTEGSDVEVPMASDAEESTTVYQEEATADSISAGVREAELNEPQEGKEGKDNE